MELKVNYRTSRSAVYEIQDEGKFYIKESCQLFLNGEEWGVTNRVINGIYDLKPDTEYRLTVRSEREEQSIFFHQHRWPGGRVNLLHADQCICV